MTTRWQDKDPSENLIVEFDFGAEATTVVSPVVTVTVAPGTDPDPALILVGAPTASGSVVTQRVQGGVDGVDYLLECRASSGADVFVVTAILPVRNRTIADPVAPRYVSEADFERRFGVGELRDLVREGHSFGQIENEAASLVDGYLASKYTLPLVSVPGIVVALTADVARYRLWDERAPEEVRRRYEDALAQLRDLAAGRMALPPGATGEPVAASFFGEGYSNARVFDEAGLRGY